MQSDEAPEAVLTSARQRRRQQPRRAATFGQRTHHVTNDYSYVHRDLITVAVVGALVIAFIVAMSFVV